MLQQEIKEIKIEEDEQSCKSLRLNDDEENEGNIISKAKSRELKDSYKRSIKDSDDEGDRSPRVLLDSSESELAIDNSDNEEQSKEKKIQADGAKNQGKYS